MLRLMYRMNEWLRGFIFLRLKLNLELGRTELKVQKIIYVTIHVCLMGDEVI